MNTLLKIILGIICIIIGLVTIFKIVNDTEVSIGLISLSFGILSIIWSFIAYTSLSRGTSLKKGIMYFSLGLLLLTMFTILQTTLSITGWGNTVLIIMGYCFIILTFTSFVLTSYELYKISKEFGFKDKAKEINQKSVKKL